jgi:aminoglycoside 3-N-acetyltransferase
MYTKQDLIKHIKEIGIQPTDTLLVHSSMKAIGDVEGRADTVLDAFMEYMKPGLLIFPTHTWDRIGVDNSVFDYRKEDSCVGILSNLFRKRPGVLRSLHPTHSVAAYGKDAAEYIAGEELRDTPCPRNGCWGKLYDRNAKILFLGCSLKCNTTVHGVEEWNDIPNRIADQHILLKIVLPDGTVMDRPMRRHHSTVPSVSDHYDKLEAPMLHYGIARKGKIGNAVSTICDVRPMTDMVSSFLKRNPGLFDDGMPVPEEWYKD